MGNIVVVVVEVVAVGNMVVVVEVVAVGNKVVVVEIVIRVVVVVVVLELIGGSFKIKKKLYF